MPISSGLYDTSTLTYDTASRSYDGYDAPLANLPSVGVFIAWTDTPYTVSPAWTEISQYVRQISIRRGRQDDLQQFGPGTASLVLDNRDRLFDPFNSSGANYANLKPRKQVKIVANWNGTEYPLYRGYVSGWPVEYTDGGLDSTVTIECIDLMALMAREVSASSYCEDYTLSLNPTVFIRMAQLSGTYKDSTVGTYTRRYYGLDTVVKNSKWQPNPAVSSGTTKLDAFVMSVMINDSTSGAQVGSVSQVNSTADGILTPALQVSANAGVANALGDPTATVAGGSFTFSCFASISGTFTTSVGILNWAPSLAPKIYVYSPTNTTVAGKIEVYSYTTAGVFWGVPTTKRMMDEAVHHYCFVVDASASVQYMYLDGELIGSQAYTGTLATSNFTQLGGGSVGAAGNITFQHMAWWEGRALSATEVATISRFGLNYYDQPAADRAQFYLNQTTVPSGLYNIDSQMSSRVAEYQLNAQPILPELQRLTAGDDGEMYVDRAGILQLVDGNQYFNSSRSNTSQMTFTDSGTGIGYDADGIRLTLTADQVRNTVVVTGSRDFQATTSDATSIATYADAAENIETRLATATDCSTLASRVLSIYKNPKMQIEPFMSKGQANPSYNWPRLLALELLDRVTFKRTPSVGSAIQKDLLVQSIEHRITPGEWQTVVNGSTRYTGWFIIGVSLIGSSEDVLL